MQTTLYKPRTWKEICETLPKDLPYKIETDKKGNIFMSPVYAKHSFFQTQIAILLAKLKPDGIATVECAVQTSDGTKVCDVAWFTKERWAQVKNDYDVHISPEIAVEVLSYSNTVKEIEQKKNLYFEAGSIEFWICDLEGNLYFYNKESSLEKSKFLPEFPKKVEEV
ncbi:MAG: Uma2 family endonuclease [Leptospiraceae bacterium]|nr:Uma2 family endonuclease [Leptospiraceae bacterium]